MKREGEKYRVSQNYGYHFGGAYNKDYSILAFIFGSPYFGKLPFWFRDLSAIGLQVLL